MTKDTFYFSHDYNARNDVKIKKLLAKHGYLGYGLFWAIIEDLYNNTNVLRLDYDTISFDLRCDKNIIYSIIHDFDLFVFDGEAFGSLSVQKRLEERNAKSEKARKSVLKRWENKGKNTNVLQTNNECNTIKERKVNENKKKEIKINKENNIFLEKKINLNHSLDVGKMVNNENYRFADANNTINNEGYRQEAKEKNYPPYSAAPPIKKEEKNENDFEAVFLADNCLDNTNTLSKCKEAKNEKENALKTNAYNCPTDFEGLWSLYQVGNYEMSSRVFHKALGLLEKEKIFKHVKEYVEKTPIEYRKNLQNYLKEKHYNDLIIDRTVSNKIAPKELPKKNINPEFEEIKKWHEEAQKRRETENK